MPAVHLKAQEKCDASLQPGLFVIHEISLSLEAVLLADPMIIMPIS